MNLIQALYSTLERPALLVLIIPAVVFYFVLLRKDFVQIKEELAVRRRRSLVQAIMLVSRTIMTLLLLVALAGPYATKEHTLQGDPYVTLLVDNSSSMALFEQTADNLQKALEKKITVERKSIGSSDKSALGDGILAHLQPRQNILLISDGNNNDGASLGDVALFASKMNSTINALQLVPVHDDVGVSVDGPSKTMENIDNTFTVLLNRVGDGAKKPVHLTVSVDGVNVVDESTGVSSREFTQTLSKGYHTIVAKIDSPDYFMQNNIYHKTVKAVPQSEILFLSAQESPLLTLLNKLYKVTAVHDLPDNVKDYYAVVVNNELVSVMNPLSDKLNDYVADGNGMVVVGGKNAYDFGDYGKSIFETLLPVSVGPPAKKPGDMNIVIVVDISGSTSASVGTGTNALGIEKAMAISAMKDLTADENLAVVAFNTAAYVVSDLSKVYEKVNLEDRIASLQYGGGTLIGVGLIKAMQLLDTVSGSKNIILVSDGKTQADSIAQEAAKAAANRGIKIYTIGVGPDPDEEKMRAYAEISNGIYFRGNPDTKLNILFGKTDKKEPKSNMKNLVVLNANHFITEGLQLNATVHGFNEITPKTTAKMLVTTNSGDPILTVWRLGLGRVASLSTDDGVGWAGELLQKPDSRLITRIMNWVIGDPDRKSKEYVEAHDTQINEPTEIVVKSDNQPTAKDVAFYKIDEDLYAGTITPHTIGFQNVAGATFGVNYPVEYENLGVSQDLARVVGSTGGRFFNAKDVDSIVEFARTQARRTINEKEYILWPWLTAAMILYVIEIFIRRIVRKE